MPVATPFGRVTPLSLLPAYALTWGETVSRHVTFSEVTSPRETESLGVSPVRTSSTPKPKPRTGVRGLVFSRSATKVRCVQDTIHRRIAVVLRESPSLTVSEIANAIKKPEGTVRLILYRHRDSLFGQDLGSKPMRWVLIGEVPPGRFVLNPGKGSKIHQVKRGRIDGHSAETAIANHDGRCGICGTTWPGGNGWSLDHDHNLEPYAPVRGVLCNTCNIGLGMFGDDLDRLRLAVDYLGGSRRG